MADKPVLTAENGTRYYALGAVNELDKGKQVIKLVGHAHCETCGACFTAGVTEKIHKCPKAVDPEVLGVYLAETGRLPARAVRERIPDGFRVD